MRYIILLSVALLFFSCQKDDLQISEEEIEEIEETGEMEEETVEEGANSGSSGFDCIEEDCEVLNPFHFAVTSVDEGIIIAYGQIFIVDAFAKVCPPDSLDFYLAEQGEEFSKIRRVAAESSSFLIEDLVNDSEYQVKMVNVHCELDSIVQPVQLAVVGEVPLPEFTDGPFAFQEFRLAADGDRYIYRTFYDDWHLNSLSNLPGSQLIGEEIFEAEWNPHKDNEVAYVQNTLIEVTPSVEGIVSESLVVLDLSTGAKEVLHDIEFLNDFSSTFNPEQYWIHEFHYSIDGNSIYLVSNKDNGSSTAVEKAIYDNIWKVDLATKELSPITNFLPIEFEMRDFIEDPQNPNNFYLLGGTYGETVSTGFPTEDRVDVYYYNSFNQSLTVIYESDYEKQFISINPTGENLTFTSNRSGGRNIWSYSLSNQSMKQITNGALYDPSHRWQHVNWVSDDEFLSYIRQDGVFKFAKFSIGL